MQEYYLVMREKLGFSEDISLGLEYEFELAMNKRLNKVKLTK